MNLIDSFEAWGIKKEKLAMLLRDNASNGVKACNDWGIPHFGCVAHCLHLIVGPFLLCSKKEEEEVQAAVALAAAEAAERDNSPAVINIDDDNEEGRTNEEDDDDDIGAFDDPFSEDDEMNVKSCRVAVNKVRTIVKFFHKSTKASSKLTEFNEGKRCDLVLDVRTRWNSTHDMLENFLEKREPVELFLSFLSTQAGQTAFGDKIPGLLPRDWALLSGLFILLEPFKKVTVDLSGNSYPSFALAIPSLLNMLKELKSEKMFDEWKYEGRDRKNVLDMLESCRKTVLESSEQRLARMVFKDGELVWITYIDPRFRDGFIIDKSMTSWEKEEALAHIRDEAFDLAQLETDISIVAGVSMSSTIDTQQQLDQTPRPKKKRRTLFDSPPPTADDENESLMDLTDGEKCRIAIRKELEYFGKPVVGKRGNIDPLIWWRDNQSEFPNLARVARKWLGVCATSTASERVFSSCGLALNAKRTKLHGTTLEAQVKLKYNLIHCGMSLDDIAAAL